MKIVVDALSARVGGGLSFLAGQVGALEDLGANLEILSAPWNHDDLAATLRSPLRRVPVPNVATRFAYEQFVLPRTAGAEVLYCPGNFVPLFATRTPRVLCVQNPNYFGYGRKLPQNLAPSRRLHIALSRASVRRAEATVVISNSLHEEMVKDGLDSDRVTVVRSGASTWAVDPEQPDMPFETPFFLSLANDYPHKRLSEIVGGWSRSAAGAGNDFPGLVMVGSISGSRREQLRATLAGGVSPTRLHFAGSIGSRRQVRWLLENCVAMIAMSEIEALPLVPIEAASLGTPTLLSDIPPHREVADGYATFVGVGDLEGLAAGLIAAARNPVRRSPTEWPITWQDNARRLMDIFESAAGTGRRGFMSVP